MSFDLRGYQATLSKMCIISGVGVHSGNPASLILHPADPNTGIIFRYTPEGSTECIDISARVPSVVSTVFCTTIGNEKFQVSTVEHIMAALFALGIDNLIVEIDGPEVPILDGSAEEFVVAIDEAGIELQAVKRCYIRVLENVRLEHGGSWAEFVPHDGTRFEIEIDFDCPAIGRQKFASEMSEGVFRRDLSRARTFGFLKDVERLWSMGKALGSSLENSVVIGDDDNVINRDGLRYVDEFVRHKTLDTLGDLALAGAQFMGCFRSYRGGHAMNAAVLRKLLSTAGAFEIVESREKRNIVRGPDFVAATAPLYAPWTL